MKLRPGAQSVLSSPIVLDVVDCANLRQVYPIRAHFMKTDQTSSRTRRQSKGHEKPTTLLTEKKKLSPAQRASKSLALDLPDKLLALADEVIE